MRVQDNLYVENIVSVLSAARIHKSDSFTMHSDIMRRFTVDPPIPKRLYLLTLTLLAIKDVRRIFYTPLSMIVPN